MKKEAAESAVERLLELHGGQIYGLGLRLCGSPEEAQDLVQETFLQAFRKWDQFEGRSSASTWLFTIAARACNRRHRLRSGQPRRLESLSTLAPSGEETILDLPSPSESPHEILERQEARELVGRAITGLPPTFRLPLVLKDLMELSIAEVAKILGLKQATVKTRLHRARLFTAKEMARGLPHRPAPPADANRTVCLDLLQAKHEAMDRGAPFPVAPDELCVRCRSLFAALDLSRDACRQLGRGELPETVRRTLLEEMGSSRPGRRRRRKKTPG